MAVFIRTDAPPLSLPLPSASANKSASFYWSGGSSPFYLIAGSSTSLTANADNVLYSKTNQLFLTKANPTVVVAGLLRTSALTSSVTFTVKMIVDGNVVASHSVSDGVYSSFYLFRPFNVALSGTIDVGVHSVSVVINPNVSAYLHDLMLAMVMEDTVIDYPSEYTPSYSELSDSSSFPSTASASANTEYEVATLSFSLPKTSTAVLIGTSALRCTSTATFYGRLYVDNSLVKELSRAPSQSSYATFIFFPLMKVMSLGTGSHTVSLRLIGGGSFYYFPVFNLLNYVAFTPL
jgi:hypothetical protein